MLHASRHRGSHLHLLQPVDGQHLWWNNETYKAGGIRTPIAVEPSLMASREYSTWKRRPSGEKVLVRYELDILVREVIRHILDATVIFAACYELPLLAKE